MKKTALLMLFLISISLCGDCFGEDCAYRSTQVTIQNPKIKDVLPDVDKEIRRSYWFYLENADVIYQANVDTPSRFIMIFIYRNIVGTFLTIASWDKSTRTSEINTMVRLGNGSSRNVRRNYDPFSVEPFVISLNIGQDERIIEFNEQGELKVDGEIAIILNEEEDSLSDRPECLDKVDRYLRKTYWYYIRGADLVSHESTVTDVRSYFVLSYVNIVGTFLVLATCNEGDIINANTFVRLGSGGRPSALLHPNPQKPSQ